MEEFNLKLSILDKIRKNESNSDDEQLLEDIRTICKKMDAAYTRFEFEKDEDLVEAAIYEIEALKSRYRYLLKIAKQRELQGVVRPADLEEYGGIEKLG